MNDHLSIPPAFCTGQRLNLWLSMRTTKAPLFGVQLVEMCKGSPVNPFWVGCMAVVKTRSWANQDVLAQNDWWGLGGSYTTWQEGAAVIIARTLRAPTSDSIEGFTADEIAQVRYLYKKFLNFAEVTGGVPVEDRTPIAMPPAKPVEPSKSAPAPQTPAPAPTPVPAPLPPAPGGEWRSKLKKVLVAVTGLLGTALTLGSIFIPDQFEVIARAVLAALKALLNVL